MMDCGNSESKLILIHLTVTKLVNVTLRKANVNLSVVDEAKVIDEFFKKIWPYIVDIDVEFSWDIVNDVEVSLFKNLIKSTESLDELLLILMSKRRLDQSVVDTFKTFLQMSKTERYRERISYKAKGVLKWGLLGTCVAALVLTPSYYLFKDLKRLYFLNTVLYGVYIPI